MIGIIKAKAPQIFEVIVTRKVHGNISGITFSAETRL